MEVIFFNFLLNILKEYKKVKSNKCIFTGLILLLCTFLYASSSFACGETVILSWGSPQTNSDGTNLTDLGGYKLYYGTMSRNYSHFIDVGNSTAHQFDDLELGRTYHFAVTAYDNSGNESNYSEEITKVVSAATLLRNDFSTDTTGDYSIVGGTGQLLYDGAGKRSKILTGDNVYVLISHDLAPVESGSFSMDFLPTVKYPAGGLIFMRLQQDAGNYYEIKNTDGYGPGYIMKMVDGVEVDRIDFLNGYSQGSNYNIKINFTPDETTVEAFGETLVLNADSSSFIVKNFNVKITQQDAYLDNILFTDNFTNVTTAFLRNDFSTDTTGDYSIIGGTGQFLYDGAGKRSEMLTGDNVYVRISHDVAPVESGSFRVDFLPTVKYPAGGLIFMRLQQDERNYYEINNTDGYGPGYITKVIDGVEVDRIDFLNGYSQGVNYQIRFNFSPDETIIEAFGETLILDSDPSSILVESFNIRIAQQDAFFDNILFSH